MNWYFGTTDGAPGDGINNPLIQPFVGDYYYYTAREIIQNSVDAKRDDENRVIVEFSLEHLKSHRFPNRKELLDIYKKCQEYDGNRGDNDAQEFLNNAIECLEGQTIPILRCSDYNTYGLEGEDDEMGKPWCKLIKQKGSSSKSEGEGGSFGIGKGAPFAASNLRVIFYSTKNINDKYIFQGIAEIVSFEIDGDSKRGSGSFGEKKYQSVRDINKIPEPFKRKETGTDLYIAGFKMSKNWKEKLAKSVLRNFWYAIYKDELEVIINDIKINKKNLEQLLTKLFQDEDPKGAKEPRGNPQYYYRAVKHGKHFQQELENLGHVEFYFLEIEEHLNYVANLRKPHMTVYARRYYFPGQYVGVFICEGKVGNKFLRKMEPPAHDKWDPDRLEEGKVIEKELHDWVRGKLKEMQKTKPSGKLNIPELYKYLPFNEKTAGEGKNGMEYTGNKADEESSQLIQKEELFVSESEVKPYSVSVMNENVTGMGGSGKIKRKGDKRRKKQGPAPGEGKGKAKAISSDNLISRTFVTNSSNDEVTYRVIIDSTESITCNLNFKAVGDEGYEDIVISHAKDPSGKKLNIKSNKIKKLKLLKGKNTITVKIKSNLKFALRLEAYEV